MEAHEAYGDWLELVHRKISLRAPPNLNSLAPGGLNF